MSVEDKIKSQVQATMPALLSADVSTPTARQNRTNAIKAFISTEDEKIELIHQSGEKGLTIAKYRATLIDEILQTAFEIEAEKLGVDPNSLSLVAMGGYGRAQLNPGSDIDILFLLPKASNRISKSTSELIQNMLYLLWDTGFKVGHASRSISECIKEALDEQQSKTALMDSRRIAGSEDLFSDFYARFKKDCILKEQEAFFELRRRDIRTRHKKYSRTVFLQEPHVKESCGGLRDYHNILWVANAKRGTTDLEALVEEKILTKGAYKELIAAFDFLHRVRNELHYHTKSSTDILTLRLQGIVATNFKYPEKSILRRCESFMRDYYRHTRSIYNHTNSLMQSFELELEDNETGKRRWLGLFAAKGKKPEKFDGFVARGGLIYPQNSNIFKENSHRLMRLFQHCQIKNLGLSPQIRKLVKANANLVDKTFRQSKTNRETFRSILERKGEVASALRNMHRVGFLGAYLPEFGAMDCLVQHEFFHRYTADEHTLRCIDQLDALLDNDSRERAIYRRFLTEMEDPYALYLALILHDTGRAENVREHIDGSAILASRVCTRLQIKGGRRSLLTFLVDHHLTFWRYATSRNLDDPTVIEEFANIMRTKSRLCTLFLFTYADSNGTNEEAWSPWKESLMLQLYHSTYEFLDNGKERYKESLKDEKDNLLEKTRKKVGEEFHEQLETHFNTMPKRYFRFREPENIAAHVKTASKFLEKDAVADHDRESALRWVTKTGRGYTELVVSSWNLPLFLEKICCALASEEINILSADVYTRTDNVVCDVFRVCTLDHQPITDSKVKKRVAEKFAQLLQGDDYDPSQFLQRKKNYLRKDTNEGGIPFPVRVQTNNFLSPTCTAIEIQALDRIGLLHDLFLEIGKLGLATVHARICTEKGAAMDTIYVSYPNGGKVEDKDKLEEIEKTLLELVGF